MLARFAAVLIALTLTTAPARAGQITTTDGKTIWHSTECTAPVEPVALPNDPETKADDMNARISAYNTYVRVSNGYADCLVKESTHDAATGGNEVAEQAQAMIDAQQKRVDTLRASVFGATR